MLFPLKNIEAHVEDRFLIIGETLYEQGKVVELTEVERHLWIATVVGNEVEVQITPSKVRACTCECDRYRAEDMCEHITAVLLKLRRETDRAKTKKARQKAKKSAPRVAKKLTTGVILQNISDAELKNYVRDYAKTNRAFALALKARFAASVPMADDREKFYQLLDTTIKDVRTKQDRVRYKGKLKLIKILRELLAQADDYIASEKFTDALYILQAVIEKGAPLFWKIEGDASKYYAEIKRAFNLLHNLLQATAAPTMKEEIWEFCLEQCSKSTYRLSGFSRSFFELLSEMANDKEKEDKILQVIDNQLEKLRYKERAKADLLIFKIQILEKQDRHEEAEKLVFENLNEPDLLLFVTQKALEKENYTRARFLAEQSFKYGFPRPVIAKAEEVLLKIAQAENNPEEIRKYARKRLSVQKKIGDFELLQEVVPAGEWDEFVDDFLFDLESQKYSMEKRDLTAEIHARCGNHGKLLDYIESIRSLDLLQRYDTVLFESHKNRVEEIYEDILSGFIRHHLGRNSSEKIRLALQHLHKVNAKKLARRLTEKFRTHYPERFTLIEELARL